MATLFPQISPKFSCDICQIKTNNKKDFSNHLLTRKHTNNANRQQSATSATANFPACACSHCGKTYASRSGAWRHERNCNIIMSGGAGSGINKNVQPENSESDIKLLTNLVLEVVKSNADFQKQMVEVCKQNNNSYNTEHHNSHNNSHNKTFNLQFFLNEQCKDAMNIMDFVNTFQLQLSDLERIGEVGYVEGISHIIIDKLNEMDIYKRPIHCSDAKREIMHIKDNNVWEKDTPNNDKLRLAIKHITKKNTDMIRPWVNKHPGVLNSEHSLNDKYQEIIIEAMGGNNGTIKENETKIIKKISKMVLIDKHM